MSLKRYLLLMLLATILCWLAFAVVIIYINPQETGFIGFLLFYISLFLALVGTFALIGFFIRIWLVTQPIFRQVIIAFRQAIWFACLVVFCLILQSQELLTWWTTVLFIALLAFIESFFLFGKKG